MKKVLVIVVLFVGCSAMAQKKRPHHPRKQLLESLDAEQIATLRTKKMTLALDLNQEQFEEVLQLNIAEVAFHKEKRETRKAAKDDAKPSSAVDRFNMANARLDRQIAMQQQLKDILTNDQYALWKELKLQRHTHGKKRFNAQRNRG